MRTIEYIRSINLASQDELRGLGVLNDLQTQLQEDVNIDLNSEDYETIDKAIKTGIEQLNFLKNNVVQNEGDFIPVYDYESEHYEVPSWKVLNPDNFSYPKWVLEIVMRKFFILPESEIQAPIYTAFALANSAAIYPKGTNRGEIPLPILYLYGQSGSGKTSLQSFINRHYPKHRCFLLKGDTTGASIRNSLHSICYINSDTRFAPCHGGLDNFYPGDIETLWRNLFALLLGNTYEQCVSGISDKGTNQTFYTRALKSISSIHPPDSGSAKKQELLTRILPIYTEPHLAENLEGYDFSDLPNTYKDIWHPNKVKSYYYPLIRQSFKLKDCGIDNPRRLELSRFILVNLVYLELCSNFDEALEIVLRYWDYVDNKLTSVENYMKTIIQHILDEQLGVSNRISSQNLHQQVSRKSDKSFNWVISQCEQIMESLGFTQQYDPFTDKTYYIKTY